MLAGVGQRMLPGVAKMLMNQFFECLVGKRAQLRSGAPDSRDDMPRVSAYEMVEVGEALETILDRAAPLGSETVDAHAVRAAAYLAEDDHWPTRTCPGLPRSSVDGYAVIAGDAGDRSRGARRGHRWATGARPGATWHRGAHHDRRLAARRARTRWSWSRTSKRSTAGPSCSTSPDAVKTCIRRAWT